LKGRYKAITAAALTAASIATYNVVDNTEEIPKELYLYFSLSEVYNNSVGDDFSYTCLLDDTKINSGHNVNSLQGETITIDIELIEREKYPDTGSGQITILIENGERASTQILLTEDKGQYAGNTALIDISAMVIEK
jgi:hypothetical protein